MASHHHVCDCCAAKSEAGLCSAFIKSVSYWTALLEFPAKSILCQGLRWSHLHWEGDQSTHAHTQIEIRIFCSNLLWPLYGKTKPAPNNCSQWYPKAPVSSEEKENYMILSSVRFTTPSPLHCAHVNLPLLVKLETQCQRTASPLKQGFVPPCDEH